MKLQQHVNQLYSRCGFSWGVYYVAYVLDPVMRLDIVQITAHVMLLNYLHYNICMFYWYLVKRIEIVVDVRRSIRIYY